MSAPTRPPRVITVRLSAELHELLKEEAYQARISLNQLCLDKLQLTHQPRGQVHDSAEESSPGDTSANVD